MKIWIVNHYAIPPHLSGGTRHFSLAKALIALGHEVTIFAANYSHFSLEYIAEPSIKDGKPSIYDEVPFVWIPISPYKGNGLQRLRGMFQFARRLFNKKYRLNIAQPDVVIGSSPQPFAAYAAYLLAKKFHAKFIYEVRDFWPESLVTLGKLTPKHPLFLIFSKIEKTLFKRSDKIVSLLPSAKKYIAESNITTDKFIWLPNFINLNLVPNYDRKNKKEKFIFTYAGHHGLANGLDNIIKAAKILCDQKSEKKFTIRLIGGGPAKQPLKDLTNEYQLDCIEFIDSVPKSEIYSYLSESDACILSLKKFDTLKKWGISPNKLYDYMAMSKPIIFSVEAANNTVEDAGAGITVNPESPQDLAIGMVTMMSYDKKILDEMGKNGRSYVENNFSLDIIANKLNNILIELITVYK